MHPDEGVTAAREGSPLSRRHVIGGAAWAAPTIVLASAAPARAASCVPVQLVTDWTSASYLRTSASTGTYTWVNPLGDGSIPLLTLAIVATVVGPLFTSLSPSDLTAAPGPIGGQGVPGLDLGLTLSQDTTAATTTGANYTFTFSQVVTNVAFTIADVDGTPFGGNANNAGAERVFLTSPSPMAGTVTDSAYVTGTGTNANPWRRRPNSSPNMANLPNTSGAGNVSVTAPALSQFALGYRLLDSTTNKPSTYNVFLAPISFTLLCP